MVGPTAEDDGEGAVNSVDTAFACLSGSDRRQLLGLLYERAPEPVPTEELAAALAALPHGKPRGEVSAEERAQAAVTLHHRHLPHLVDAGFVDHDDEGTVALADHPALRDPGIVAAVEDDARTGPGPLDALFAALSRHRRRVALDVLSHQYQPIKVETLARDVAARERDVDEHDVSTGTVEEVLVSLRHVHLPRLTEADLVEHDTDEGTVSYAGHPDLRVPWMHSEFGPEFRSSLTDGLAAEVGPIEGRERVVSYGQSLCDAADEELFLMFTTTGLLEAGCSTRIAQAVDRGVDVYLGTCDPVVREFVHENAPDVTLWEPDTNWLDLPVEEDNVGRLVFADREAVMVGTLGEQTDDGEHVEQAIVGEGDHNALVVMMRQLLGSRLDRFGDQTEEMAPDVSF